MRHYEVTFIVDPVLSGDEIKTTAQTYVDMLQQEGCTIVHRDEMGLRQLAYPIKKRNSGVYYCVEFSAETGAFIPKVELAFSRDERIMRFLTVALDKFGVKYNEDKRAGLIGKKTTKKAVAAVEGEGVATKKAESKPKAEPKEEPKAEPKAEAKAEPKAEPIAAAPAPVAAPAPAQEEE
ncbi:MAG: 30S ribosomal protein S6 [Saprospiraceae bacterium]|nr:30S ribosomal protein S6 [Saprospiraceae bacterium]